MSLQFTPQNAYAWSPNSSRPGKPTGFSQELVHRFLDTTYANKTTLAEFIRAHPNAMSNGVLNQLHRRHVIPWNLIKEFIRRSAEVHWNNEMKGLTRNIFDFFRVNATAAMSLPHGPQRAAEWGKIANHMCWVESNVFVGPSAGNIGVDIDQGDELTDVERRDLLAGSAWKGASIVFGQMEGLSRS